MVFSSTVFTFLFLPVVLALYYLAKERYRNAILLAASIFFYAYGEPYFVFIMLASVLLNYLSALLVDRYRGSRKAAVLLAVDIALNLGILFIFKYLDFSIRVIDSVFKRDLAPIGIALPIGISFFTFQAMSYVIDVYRGTAPVQKNPLNVALYISFFPQLIAGPIVRYNTIAKQIEERTCSVEKFGEGAKRFMTGFGKKVILANNLALVAEEAFRQTDFASGTLAYSWLGAIAFSLQIFYDFSGYSDMAIGLGKMFGFEFLENFDYPYISASVTEFWRRWHMSLGQWFRDYVYIPLGGSREGTGKTIRNLFVVWLLTGIWHGANYTFIFWGLSYFVLLILEKYVIRPGIRGAAVRFVWRVFTLLCVNFLWVLFNAPSMNYAMNYLLSMAGWFRTPAGFAAPSVLRVLREFGIYYLLGLLFAAPVLRKFEQKLETSATGRAVLTYVSPVLYILMFLWAVSFLILGAHNPFIYFNF